MPSPRRRAKGRRDTLSPGEEVELVLGPAPGARSVFADARERAEARALLARIQEDRSRLEQLLADGPIGAERFRRHMLFHADQDPHDPDYPAVLRIDLCPLCHPGRADA